ncbi:ERF family protein [Duganella callida]|nr:ERF family protein [Duganella callida]
MNDVLEMEKPAAEQRAIAAPAAQPLAVVPTTPFELVAHAAARGASMEELRTFIELQERLEANQARKAYVAAMAEFKRNPPQIVKDKLVSFDGRDGSNTSYMHATLGSVCGAIVEGLGRQGFSHRWDTEQPPSGMVSVTCTITHSMGHSEVTRMQAPPDASGKKNAIQQIASTITYLQRYTLLAACGLATNEQMDDDGHGGQYTPVNETPAATTVKGQTSSGLPLCSDDLFAVESPKWRKVVESGKKTAEEMLATVSTRATFTEAQKKTILSWTKKPADTTADNKE